MVQISWVDMVMVLKFDAEIAILVLLEILVHVTIRQPHSLSKTLTTNRLIFEYA